MISILLAYNEKTKHRAIEAGFVEQTVLVRHESIMSNDTKKKSETESKIGRDLRPYQYVVVDFWGMCPD